MHVHQSGKQLERRTCDVVDDARSGAEQDELFENEVLELRAHRSVVRRVLQLEYQQRHQDHHLVVGQHVVLRPAQVGTRGRSCMPSKAEN